MFLRRPQKIIAVIAAAAAIFFLLASFHLIPGLRRAPKPLPLITLNFWGVGDDRSIFDEIIGDYARLHPNVRIVYRPFDESVYEREWVNALAADQPVDIVMFRNSWLPKHFDKIIPLTAADADAPNADRAPPFSFTDFQNLYPTVAIQDFAPDQKTIYAAPLFIDTLAMFYNRDIFDNRAIALPPRHWADFLKVIKQLSARSPQRTPASPPATAGGLSVVSPLPAALGGSNATISHATDLLNLLFLQSGAPMIDHDFSRALFANEGQGALSFYTQFADPRSEYYSWPPGQPYSLDSFAGGGTAIIFGYQNQLKDILARNPHLPYRIAAMPQPLASAQAVNWARYYGLAISRASAHPAAAKDFILFLAANQPETEKYLLRSGRPPALRVLIEKTLTDPELGVFARQALSARSYPQADDAAVEAIFSRMIESVISNQLSPYSAIVRAEAEMTQLIQRRKR